MVRTKIDTWCGSLRLSRSNVDSASTIEVRRINPPGRHEHVQIALTVVKYGPKRTITQSGYIELLPEQVAPLITALTKLHAPYDHSAGHIDFAESERRAREFYGLTGGP